MLLDLKKMPFSGQFSDNFSLPYLPKMFSEMINTEKEDLGPVKRLLGHVLLSNFSSCTSQTAQKCTADIQRPSQLGLQEVCSFLEFECNFQGVNVKKEEFQGL